MYRVSDGVNVDTRLSAFTINSYYFKDLPQLTLEVVLCDLCLKGFLFFKFMIEIAQNVPQYGKF